MNCNDSTAMVAAYVDGETDRPQSRSIRDHMLACPACAARHEALLALRGQIRADVPRYSAPPVLVSRIREALDAARRTRRARSWLTLERWRWLTGGALAGCAATMLTWSVATTVADWRVNEDVAVEAVGSHVRATLGNQLIQVASSDQHTVKPWLSARLDYSPPMPEVRQEGITLSGGRVDYLDRRPVATLVYRIRNHSIDVFVTPVSARTSPVALRTVRGFNVAHATGGGMDWLAVSDVSADVLTSFVQQIARGPQMP